MTAQSIATAFALMRIQLVSNVILAKWVIKLDFAGPHIYGGTVRTAVCLLHVSFWHGYLWFCLWDSSQNSCGSCHEKLAIRYYGLSAKLIPWLIHNVARAQRKRWNLFANCRQQRMPSNRGSMQLGERLLWKKYCRLSIYNEDKAYDRCYTISASAYAARSKISQGGRWEMTCRFVNQIFETPFVVIATSLWAIFEDTLFVQQEIHSLGRQYQCEEHGFNLYPKVLCHLLLISYGMMKLEGWTTIGLQ